MPLEGWHQGETPPEPGYYWVIEQDDMEPEVMELSLYNGNASWHNTEAAAIFFTDELHAIHHKRILPPENP